MAAAGPGVRERLRAPTLDAAGVFACADALQREAADGAGPRIAIAGDLTLDFLQRAIACAVALEGAAAHFHLVPFGAARQQCLDAASSLHAFRPDCVVLVPHWRAALDDGVAGFEALWAALAALGCPIIQHTLVPPARHWRGMAERLRANSPAARVSALNAQLLAAGQGRVTWLEADRLAADVGLAAWAPARFHHAGQLPFDPRFLPNYIPWFRAAWRSATGREKKVLVLDLDDTLWGGTIGDDGVEGIVLGPDHGSRGEAFAAWQAYLAELAAQGVILAVSSKNDPAVASTGFLHAASALRRDQFAAFACSWGDKAQGLRRIAAELGLALDTMVLADDNPAECALVRELLPQVEVVELGADPSQFIDRLEAGHWFDLQLLTAEDRGRGRSYAARAEVLARTGQAPGVEAFLAGLRMVGRVAPAQPADLPRLAQMELKTNQFNLTTRRASQDQLRDWLADPHRLVLTLRLRDRLADHGLVGSLVVLREADAWRIDSWLLSCRVFARTAEHFMLGALLRAALAQGVASIEGEYVATPRNAVVAGLYRSLGFEAASPEGRWWRLAVDRQGLPSTRIAEDGPEDGPG